MSRKARFVALGSRLEGVKEVCTLGVRPNFHDYTPREREMIFSSCPLLFPTRNYAQVFSTMGHPIFPSLATYLFADDKLKQTTLFYTCGIPHPRTRIYYHLHHREILRDFDFPFIGKLPVASAGGRGVFKITNREELEAYLRLTSVAYIQEYIPHDRDVRVVLVNYDPVVCYWRVPIEGDFRTNLYQGGHILFDDVPDEAVSTAIEAARLCNFDDVGLDLIFHRGRWLVIEANMKYGRKGLALKGLDIKEVIRKKLLSGELG